MRKFNISELQIPNGVTKIGDSAFYYCKGLADAKNKIREILTARRRFYEASITLLECDNTFADMVKRTLENMTFSSKIVNIVGAGGCAIPLNGELIRFYLETVYKICVREENITVDFEKHRCCIKLNGNITAHILIKDGIGIKNLTPLKCR